VENIEDVNVLKLKPVNRHGTVVEIIKSFGGTEQYEKAIMELEEQLYLKAQ